jgi:hypothetical protein
MGSKSKVSSTAHGDSPGASLGGGGDNRSVPSGATNVASHRGAKSS